MEFLLKQEGVWSDVEIRSSAVLEILLPNETVVIKRGKLNDGNTSSDDDNVESGQYNASYNSMKKEDEISALAEGIQSLVLDPSPECVTKVRSV